MLTAGIYDSELAGPFLFWRNIAVDYRRGYDGFYGAAAGAYDVASV